MYKLELEVGTKEQLLEVLNRLIKLDQHNVKPDQYSIELEGIKIGELTVRGDQ